MQNSHDPVLLLTTMNGAATDVHMATSTPPPLNGVGVNGNAAANDSESTGTLKFTTGLILPPPDVKCTSSVILGSLINLQERLYAHLRSSYR
jgi:hypothetical protein